MIVKTSQFRVTVALLLLILVSGRNNTNGLKQLRNVDSIQDSNVVPGISTMTNNHLTDENQFRREEEAGDKSTKESTSKSSRKMMSSKSIMSSKSMKMKMSSKDMKMKDTKSSSSASSKMKTKSNKKSHGGMDKKMSHKQMYDEKSSKKGMKQKSSKKRMKHSAKKSMKKKSLKTNEDDSPLEDTETILVQKRNDNALKILSSSSVSTSSTLLGVNNNYPNEISKILLEEAIQITNSTSN